MLPYKFDEKKTLRISGVSELLHDEIVKALQGTNSTGFTGDVERIYVCPGGEDYVLVEFYENIPGYFVKILFCVFE